MKTIIETTLKTDVNGETKTWSVILDNEQLVQIARASGLEAANTALDKFVATYVTQFKQNLGSFINK